MRPWVDRVAPRAARMRTPSAIASLLLVATTACAVEFTVCPAAALTEHCDFGGNDAIQSAVDRASDGDSILLRAGTYVPETYRDVSFRDYVIRGAVVIDRKQLRVVTEPGVVIDGERGVPSSAFIVNHGSASFEGLTIRGFRVTSPTDDLYDGHGIFVIDSTVDISNTCFAKIEKMSISIRGTSTVTVTNTEIVDGHVGIWSEEDARVRVVNSLFHNNDSAGIASYASSSATVRNSVFSRNLDDGVYAADNAAVEIVNTLFVGNRPYAVRSVDASTSVVRYSAFSDNESDFSPAAETASMHISNVIRTDDLRLDGAYDPLPGSPLLNAGDPLFTDADGSSSDIGRSHGSRICRVPQN